MDVLDGVKLSPVMLLSGDCEGKKRMFSTINLVLSINCGPNLVTIRTHGHMKTNMFLQTSVAMTFLTKGATKSANNPSPYPISYQLSVEEGRTVEIMLVMVSKLVLCVPPKVNEFEKYFFQSLCITLNRFVVVFVFFLSLFSHRLLTNTAI